MATLLDELSQPISALDERGVECTVYHIRGLTISFKKIQAGRPQNLADIERLENEES